MAGLIGRVLVTGAAAALASAATALTRSRIERGRATPPLNAVSHIAWGGEPPADIGPKGINLATGVALHAGASLFWATNLELAFGRAARRSRAAAWLGGAIVSAVAFVTDYYLVSRRFQPGYEAYLSRLGLLAVYAAIAAGLPLGARSTRLDDHEPENSDERDERRHAEPRPDRVIAPERGRQRPEAAPKSEPAADAAPDEARHRRIAERAYGRAERRGFAPGKELDDWLAAEAEEGEGGEEGGRR